MREDFKNCQTSYDILNFNNGPSIGAYEKELILSDFYKTDEFQKPLFDQSAKFNSVENKPLGGPYTSPIRDNDDYNSGNNSTNNDSTEKFTEVTNYEQEHFMDSFRWHHICSIIIFLLFITFGIYLYCNS